MTEGLQSRAPEDGVDVGDFCRRVEEHLARVNDGHLIRIVGPAFDLVRAWALEGIPLSVVCHGISMKAERHRAGRSKRPLRLEFCEVDVRVAFDGWRRAVGISSAVESPEATAEPTTQEERRRPSLTRHLDRAIDRLSSVAGRLDRSDSFRDAVGRVLQDMGALRDASKGARGPAREALDAKLPALDELLLSAGRLEVGDAGLARLLGQAADELGAYRGRLTPDAWARSLDLGVDRLLREQLGLPTLTP